MEAERCQARPRPAFRSGVGCRAAICPRVVRRAPAMQIVGSGGPVQLAISPVGPETCNLFMGGRRGDTEGFGHSLQRLPVLLQHGGPAPLDCTASIWHSCGCSPGSPWICYSGKYRNFRSGPNGQQSGYSSQLGNIDESRHCSDRSSHRIRRILMGKIPNQSSGLLLDLARFGPNGVEIVVLMLETDFISIKVAEKALSFIKKLLAVLMFEKVLNIKAHQPGEVEKAINDCQNAAKNLKKAIDDHKHEAKELNKKSDKAPHRIS